MLSFAAEKGRIDVVRFLVSSDADIAYHDYNDNDPYCVENFSQCIRSMLANLLGAAILFILHFIKFN